MHSYSKLKICVAFSCGGHYAEAMQLMPIMKNYTVYYAAPYAATTKDLKRIYFLKDPADIGNFASLFLNIVISLKMLIKERPDVIVTTGAEIVIPLCYLSKTFFRTKIVFIETFARVTSPSFTGRIIYPVADIFLVQWQNLLVFYGKKAQYVGRLF